MRMRSRVIALLIDLIVLINQQGDFINAIQELYNLEGDSFLLIGHSLGAHVAGNAGAAITRKISRIIGLDPAGPLFSVGVLDDRLDTSDASFVQIIHTNGEILGFDTPIGHVDYFPNGGMSQPGCGLDLAGTCSHSRSYYYLAEAIARGEVFKSLLCTTYDQFQENKCEGNRISFMGQLDNDE